MKMLMASHYFVSHKGGVEVVAEELFRAFTGRDHEVVWMASDSTPAPEPLGKSRAVSLPVFNFVEDSIGLPFPIPRPEAVRMIFREVNRAEIILLHDCLYLSNILAFLAARKRGIPVIIVQHTRFFPNGSFLMNAIMRLAAAIVTRPMLSRAAQVVFISQTTRSAFAQLRFRNPPKIIFNGVDTDIFRKLEESETVPALRRGFGLPEEDTVILFVGRFVEKKGLAALQCMAAQRPQWTWAFAGWGPLDPLNWNLENVQVFSGLWGSSMAALFRCCNLLVLPSTGEGFPLVVQEALASGIPVVCGEETLRADPAMGEFVKGAPVFLRDDERTAHEFLAAIDQTLASDAGPNNKSAQRRAFAESRYSWRYAADRYLEIASRLVPNSAMNAANSAPQSGRIRG